MSGEETSAAYRARLAAEYRARLAAEYRARLAAVRARPAAAPRAERALLALLRTLNDALAEADDVRAIFDNLGEAFDLYPNSASLLNDIGTHLYRCGLREEALERFERAAAADPAHVEAEKNLNSVKNLAVERWHYRMLNDRVRNAAYRRAVAAGVRAAARAAGGARALDLGAGVGLLALYARRAGAASVVACEGARALAGVARAVLRRAGAADVPVLASMSFELRARDVGGRRSLLVTELFDAGLLGERALPALAHAWERLLAPGAVVVPAGAEFFVRGVRSERLVRHYHLGAEAKRLLGVPAADVRVRADEPYDCEDVGALPDVEYVTGPRSLFAVNFADPRDVRAHLERAAPYEAELRAERAGRLDVVVGWFTLRLPGAGALTTDPRAPGRAAAWQQAVFFDAPPTPVARHESVRLRFDTTGDRLTMSPAPAADGGDVERVSSEMIRFLNDAEYTRAIVECAEGARELPARAGGGAVADLCPFPLFGLLLVERGARALVWRAAAEGDRRFVERVWRARGLPAAALTVVCGGRWPRAALEAEYAAIFSHELEPGGDAAPAGVALRLAAGGLRLPAAVRPVARLVRSARLRRDNRLDDRNLCGVRAARDLDRYAVTQNFGVDVSSAEHAAVSAPVQLWAPGARGRHEARVAAAGAADALLCWWRVWLRAGAAPLSTRRAGCFMDGMAFLPAAGPPVSPGRMAKIIQYNDDDGRFKLAFEYEPD